MSKTMTANGLTLKPIHSKSEQVPEKKLSELITSEHLASTISEYLQTPSFFVAYLDYRVVVGRYTDNEFVFYKREDNEEIEPKYLQRLRVFNKDEELLLWRSGPTLKGRFRKDGEGDEVDIVEAKQVLFGTRKGEKRNQHFTENTEDRGTSLILPVNTFQFDEKGNRVSRVWLITHNYIDYNPAHQATYVDCRFVGFANLA